MAKVTRSSGKETDESVKTVDIKITVSESLAGSVKELFEFWHAQAKAGIDTTVTISGTDKCSQSEQLILATEASIDKFIFEEEPVQKPFAIVTDKKSKDLTSTAKAGTCDECGYVGKPMGKVCPECGKQMSD